MSNQEKKGGNLIAIATMFALYGMVGFVTFMAAPVGAIWKEQPGIAGSNGERRNHPFPSRWQSA